MTSPAQIISSSQAGGASADHGGGLAGFLFGRAVEFIHVLQNVIAHRALHAVDAHAVAVYMLVAFLLAGMRAHAGGQHRQRVGAHEDFSRSVHIPLADFFHIGGDVGIGRTAVRARCLAHLHRAEDGMIPVFAHHGIAQMAVLAGAVDAAANGIWIAVIPAAHILADVSAHGGGVAQVGGSHGIRRVRKRGPLAAHHAAGCDIGQSGQSRPDAGRRLPRRCGSAGVPSGLQPSWDNSAAALP